MLQSARASATVAVTVAAVAAVLLGAVYFVALRAPSVGLYHDDGVYTVTAKALAEGRGYRIISLPNEIPQTKYPFLFPAILSLAWRLWPDFPANLPALKTVPLLCSLGWFALSYRLLLTLGAAKPLAMLAVMLTAASPLVIYLSTNMMSEPMFSALFTGALLAAHAGEQGSDNRMAWVAGALAALAYLTRTIGVSLLIGIPVGLALQRRFGATWRFLSIAVPIASVWPVWVRLHPPSSDPSLFYYSVVNYSSSNVVISYPWDAKVTILLSNIVMSLVSPLALLDLRGSLWAAALVLGFLLVALFRFRDRPGPVQLGFAAYIAVVLCWAWPPNRFLSVILPFVFWVLMDAVAVTLRNRQAQRLVVVCAGLMFSLVLIKDLRRIPQTIAEGQFVVGARPADNWGEMSKVFSWIRSNSSGKAVLLGNLDPSFYLFTGRKAMRDFMPDARKLFYAAGSPTSDSLGSLDEIMRSTSAAYLILTPDDGFVEMPVLRRNLEQWKARHPGKLEPVNRPDANPEYRIYRIR